MTTVKPGFELAARAAVAARTEAILRRAGATRDADGDRTGRSGPPLIDALALAADPVAVSEL
jgi:hypothetical protein